MSLRTSLIATPILLILNLSRMSSQQFKLRSQRTSCHQELAFCLSCPPPRFDTFADNIIGPWEDSFDGSNTNRKRGEVEEVMRSCGGAVQGIREIPLLLPPSPRDGDYGGHPPKYHNRADNGFLFFDCGSYVSLPIDSSVVSSSGTPFNSIMCNLSLPILQRPGQKIRIVLTTGPSSFQVLVRNGGGTSRFKKNTSERKKLGDSDGDNENDSIFSGRGIMQPLTCPPESVRWEKGIFCRMSSPEQPWILQRALWERYSREVVDSGDNNDIIYGNRDDVSSSSPDEQHPNKRDEAVVNPNMIESWITTFNADKNNSNNSDDRFKLLAYVGKGGNNNQSNIVPKDTSTILQMGYRCLITNKVKAILCFYGKNNEVKGVSLQEGYTK